jgi:hypothetical protein
LKAGSGAAAAATAAAAAVPEGHKQQGVAGKQGDDFSLDDAAAGAGGARTTAAVNPLSRKGLPGTMASQQPPSLGFVSAASLTNAAADSTAISGNRAAVAAGDLNAATDGWRVKQPASRGPAAARTQPAGFSSSSRLTAGSSRALAGNGHVNGGRKDPAAALAQELKAVDDSDDDFM